MKFNNAMFLFPACVIVVTSSVGARAATVPFTESFDAGSADWFDASGGSPLSWNPAGGEDGAFASSTFNFVGSAEGDTPVLFRAQDEFGAAGSSGGAFIGDWISDGVTTFSAFVRHDANVPLTIFTRFSSPFNFPGAVAIQFAPVSPDTWTEITVPIDANNPQFVTFEGTDFGTVFGNIGHVQIGVSVPAELAGVDQAFTFGVDTASIVPEPATASLLLISTLGVWMRRRIHHR
jgi:hypothetical protein